LEECSVLTCGSEAESLKLSSDILDRKIAASRADSSAFEEIVGEESGVCKDNGGIDAGE